jgi:hypothetical protein
VKEYFENIPRRSAAGPSEAPPRPQALTPTAAEIMAAATTEGAWLVPVEIILAVTSSAMKAVILARHGRGEHPRPLAQVIARGNRFWATVLYPGKADLFLPLDCFTWENTPGAPS